MKKTLILLLFLVIAACAYYFIGLNGGNDSSINIDNRNFVVENIDDISFLTLKNKGYPLVHLEKKSKDYWVLNKKYKADINVVDNMLGVLVNMKIRNIPTKARNENVINNLNNVGIEISTFDKNGKVLSELVMGDNDNKEGATYCIRKGFKQSYAMHVKVAEGGLRNYFDQTQLSLRDKSVFDIDAAQIKSLKMSYLKDKKNSFKISKSKGGYEIIATEQFGNNIKQGNNNIIEAYVKDYSTVYSEVIRTGDTSLDSIRNLIPFAKLEFELLSGKSESFEFYPMVDLLVKEANTQTIRDLSEVERFFVFASNKEVYVVQRRLIKEFFKPIAYFY